MKKLNKDDKDIIIDICFQYDTFECVTFQYDTFECVTFQYISLLAGQKGLDRIKHQIDIELSKRSIEIPEKNNKAILETAILNNV